MREALLRHALTMEKYSHLRGGRGGWLESELGDQAGEADWCFRKLRMLWVGDLATKDGLRLKPWRQLQREGAVEGQERKWYGWLRGILCEEGSGLLKKPVEKEAPEVGDFALCWETEEEFRLEGSSELRPVVRVEELDGNTARVRRWNYGGDGTGPTFPYKVVERDAGRWVELNRLVWVGGEEMGTPGEAGLWVGAGEWEKLTDRARECCEEEGDDASDTSSDDGWEPPGLSENLSVCYSDGSHYPAEGGVPLDGWAVVRFERGRGKVVVRDSVDNGGLPPEMFHESSTGEVEGLLEALRQHLRRRGEGWKGRTRVWVDCQSLVAKVRGGTRAGDWRYVVELPDRPQWLTLWALLRDVHKAEFDVRWHRSHVGNRGEAMADKHAKRAARESAGVRSVPRDDLVDMEWVVACSGVPLRGGVKAFMRKWCDRRYREEWHAQASRGRRSKALSEAGVNVGSAWAGGTGKRFFLRALSGTADRCY